MQAVLNDIDRINIEDENGDRLVRIHAIGFPYSLREQNTSEFPEGRRSCETSLREKWRNIRRTHK